MIHRTKFEFLFFTFVLFCGCLGMEVVVVAVILALGNTGGAQDPLLAHSSGCSGELMGCWDQIQVSPHERSTLPPVLSLRPKI